MAYGLSDRSRSRVVIVGSSQFDHLDGLPAVEANVNELARLLRHRSYWGVDDSNCRVLLNPATPHDVDIAIRAAASEVEPDGMLLIYYAGHGIVGGDRNFYLALPGTTPDAPHSTAVPYDWVRMHVNQNRATQRLVILDCCYAGRAQMGRADPKGLARRIAVNRSCLLLAVAENAQALAPEGDQYTAFTGELIDLLVHGVPRGPSLLDIRTIWEHLNRRLTERGRPEPQLRSDNAGEDMPLVANQDSASRDRHGQVLYAHPSVDDPDLKQAVIVILRHNPGGGTVGVVVNRPTAIPVQAVAGDWRAICNDPQFVFDGGPVEHEGHIPLTLLFETAREPSGFRPVAGRLGTLNLSVLPEDLGDSVEDLRLFSGYLGWGPGELELEIAQDVLIPTDRSARLAFRESTRTLWQDIQRPQR